MSKDKLYLLKPDFMDGNDGPYYCPDSLPIEGVLGLYPHLKQAIDVMHVDFLKPRQPIVDEIGPDNQSAPVLIISKKPASLPEGLEIHETNGKWFITDEKDIRIYLAAAYHISLPHP